MIGFVFFVFIFITYEVDYCAVIILKLKCVYLFPILVYLFKQIVERIVETTEYGSQFDEGRRSSKYPQPASATPLGMRIEAPR